MNVWFYLYLSKHIIKNRNQRLENIQNHLKQIANCIHMLGTSNLVVKQRWLSKAVHIQEFLPKIWSQLAWNTIFDKRLQLP